VTVVIDTSVLLAVFFNESHARWCAARLDEHRDDLVMSTVNLAETLMRVKDRQPRDFPKLERRLLNSGIRHVEPDVDQARIAARARDRYPLNMGDCFAYALSVVLDSPILTLDKDFRKTDRPLLMP